MPSVDWQRARILAYNPVEGDANLNQRWVNQSNYAPGPRAFSIFMEKAATFTKEMPTASKNAQLAVCSHVNKWASKTKYDPNIKPPSLSGEFRPFIDTRFAWKAVRGFSELQACTKQKR